MTKRYEPKMNSRVRIARTDVDNSEYLGAVGRVCGMDGAYATAVELDEEIYGVWILPILSGSFRLEAE